MHAHARVVFVGVCWGFLGGCLVVGVPGLGVEGSGGSGGVVGGGSISGVGGCVSGVRGGVAGLRWLGGLGGEDRGVVEGLFWRFFEGSFGEAVRGLGVASDDLEVVRGLVRDLVGRGWAEWRGVVGGVGVRVLVRVSLRPWRVSLVFWPGVGELSGGVGLRVLGFYRVLRVAVRHGLSAYVAAFFSRFGASGGGALYALARQGRLVFFVARRFRLPRVSGYLPSSRVSGVFVRVRLGRGGRPVGEVCGCGSSGSKAGGGAGGGLGVSASVLSRFGAVSADAGLAGGGFDSWVASGVSRLGGRYVVLAVGPFVPAAARGLEFAGFPVDVGGLGLRCWRCGSGLAVYEVVDLEGLGSRLYPLVRVVRCPVCGLRSAFDFAWLVGYALRVFCARVFGAGRSRRGGARRVGECGGGGGVEC